MTTQSLPSLYDRLGGVYSIATVVDDLIERIMIDPRLKDVRRRSSDVRSYPTS